MKEQIRESVFETNSSSTHSICICAKSQYDAWKNGEFYYNVWDDEFATKAFVDTKVKEGGFDADEPFSDEGEFRRDELGWFSADEFFDWDYQTQETYTEYYTSPSGDEIVVFGSYGYDG